jgi:hypothetical protein
MNNDCDGIPYVNKEEENDNDRGTEKINDNSFTCC